MNFNTFKTNEWKFNIGFRVRFSFRGLVLGLGLGLGLEIIFINFHELYKDLKSTVSKHIDKKY